MELSLFLGKVIGLYLIIVSIAVILRRPAFESLLQEASQSHCVMVFSAVLMTIIGLLIVVSHNVWVDDWRIVITLLGWLTLIKGLGLFYFPTQMKKSMTFWLDHYNYMVVVAVVYVIIGLYLCIYSFG